MGSTSINQLSAKPKIDILLVVKNPANTIIPLATIGYEYKGEYNIPLHWGFSKRGAMDFNLHCYKEHHPDIDALLLFKHYLMQNQEAKQAYETLKQSLLRENSFFTKDNTYFSEYTLQKNSFIQNILSKAGFDRLRIMKCVHYNEWAAAQKYQELYYKNNPSTTLKVNNCIENNFHHVILYKGCTIIGYAYIKLLPNNQYQQMILVVDDEKYQDTFRQLIQEWLS